MQIIDKDKLNKKCNFCDGALLVISITNAEFKLQIKVKKIKRVCQICTMQFEDFVTP